MDDNKIGVAVLVKSRLKAPNSDRWQDGYLFGGKFENLAESLGYLRYLESRNTEFIVQIGYVGWRRNEENS